MDNKKEKYLAHQSKVIEEWKKEINETDPNATKFKVFEGRLSDYYVYLG
jgi:hypothetical protein